MIAAFLSHLQLSDPLSGTVMMTKTIAVMLIDDQPLMAAAVRRLLAAAPEMVMHYCSDPSKAEAEVEVCAPSVVIVDMVMPVVGGLEVIQRLRTNPKTATMPIIMMSSIDDPHTKAESLNIGADDYLVKLPDGTELIARIRALIRRASWHTGERGCESPPR
ncbi:MAG: hypothetical protein C0467_01300 [Planctomycetaceae bacterium]|nr:hypothetical protein [Planctomycetaceae bacterium]